MTTKPLQTHGLFRLAWQPPRDDRLCSYGPRDEAWMRPLGLGKTTRTPECLFDVRREDGTLLGYCQYEPSAVGHRMAIPVVSQPPLRFYSEDEPISRPEILQAHVRIGRYVRGRDEFRCWMPESPKDAKILLQSGWIQEIVSVANGDRGIVRDARGIEVKRCLSANLTTGKCVVYRTDSNGLIVVDRKTRDAVRDEVFRSAPLTFERNHEWEQAEQEATHPNRA